jgi:hypothetical protein
VPSDWYSIPLSIINGPVIIPSSACQDKLADCSSGNGSKAQEM